MDKHIHSLICMSSDVCLCDFVPISNVDQIKSTAYFNTCRKIGKLKCRKDNLIDLCISYLSFVFISTHHKPRHSQSMQTKWWHILLPCCFGSSHRALLVCVLVCKCARLYTFVFIARIVVWSPNTVRQFVLLVSHKHTNKHVHKMLSARQTENVEFDIACIQWHSN